MLYRGKIRALYFSPTRKLLSAAEDKVLGVWDLESERQEVGPVSAPLVAPVTSLCDLVVADC